MKMGRWMVAALLVAGLCGTGTAQAGDLNPPGPPGATMRTLQEIYDKLLEIEAKIDAIAGEGVPDFDGTSITILYEDFNMDELNNMITLQNLNLTSIQISNFDNNDNFLELESIAEGSDRLYLYDELEPANQLSAIDVHVLSDGTMDTIIYPYVEGCFEEFDPSELNLPDIDSFSISDENVACFFGVHGDDLSMHFAMGNIIVFALESGSTTFTLTSAEDYEATIQVEVDENRVITEFDITPSGFE